MRFGPNDTFWVVTDPTFASTPTDILTKTTLAGLRNQFASGLQMSAHPTILTDRAEAQREAQGRWFAMQTAMTIVQHAAEGGCFDGAREISVMDEKGRVVFETELPGFASAEL